MRRGRNKPDIIEEIQKAMAPIANHDRFCLDGLFARSKKSPVYKLIPWNDFSVAKLSDIRDGLVSPSGEITGSDFTVGERAEKLGPQLATDIRIGLAVGELDDYILYGLDAETGEITGDRVEIIGREYPTSKGKEK